MSFLPLFLTSAYKKIKSIGHYPAMDEYEKRKLSVFNQVNFLGIFAGITVSIAGLFDNQHLPVIESIIAFSPVIISLVVILLNYYKRYEWSRLLYFSLYPVLTSLAYRAGINLGLELFFILYAVLAVFYMQKPANAIISFVLASGCYLVVYVFAGNYTYNLRSTSFPFYIFIHVLALLLIFFALFWIKKENVGYQFSILQKNEELNNTNLEIEKQKKEIGQKADELTELNLLKNKLFSVISHDLKGPIYAQRNLFQNIQQYDLPGEEIKELVPDILSDMNYTITLMDNLLQWAKSQMQSELVDPQLVDISAIINSVAKLMRLQAQAKGVRLICNLSSSGYAYADGDMINLVLRNLISNAIKFTVNNGEVVIESKEVNNFIEISVRDSGIGMTEDTLTKILQKNFYTTKGTANESGTGLGLMLCNEFLQKNNSILQIASQYGNGSTFSFKLPLQHECIFVN